MSITNHANASTWLQFITTKLATVFQIYRRPYRLNTPSVPARRTDLDLLRILLFGLLITHHIGMFYVENWGWHGKSQYRWQWLESVLLIVEPWRMPAIWFISGVAMHFLLAKSTTWRFVALRTHRLLLPLLFGVLVIVPPQLYVEMTQKGEIAMNYWQFLQAFIQTDHPAFVQYDYGIWPHIDVNHLWYLRSLWYYTLLLVALLPVLHSQWLQRVLNHIGKQPIIVGVIALLTPVLLIQFFWEINNTRYPLGCYFLLLGYVLAFHQPFWQVLQRHKSGLLISSVLLLLCLIILYNTVWLKVIHEQEVAVELKTLVMLIYSSTRIVGLLTVLMLISLLTERISFANHPQRQRRLTYWQNAVYPFYILHQSVILVVGHQLTQHNLGGAVEFSALLVFTFAICWLGYEVIHRVELLRPLFGMKTQQRFAPHWYKLGYIMSATVLTPLIWQLI